MPMIQSLLGNVFKKKCLSNAEHDCVECVMECIACVECSVECRDCAECVVECRVYAECVIECRACVELCHGM